MIAQAFHRLQAVKLRAFSKFENTTDALAAATSVGDSKLGKSEQRVASQTFKPVQTHPHLAADRSVGGVGRPAVH